MLNFGFFTVIKIFYDSHLAHKAFLCIWGLFLGISACGCCYLLEIKALIQHLPVFFPQIFQTKRKNCPHCP